jgi:Glycosyl transferase family 64 domain
MSNITTMPNITVILLSWKRPDIFNLILSELNKNKQINEIIVWNNNPEIRFAGNSVTVVNSSQNFYCVARYACALLAKNETIIFRDDDLLFSAESIDMLISEYMKDNSRIYGGRGRNVVDGVYRVEEVYGSCDIILGHFMLFSKALLSKVYGDILRLTPFYRGDDIAFSLLSGVKHAAFNLSPKPLGSSDSSSLWRQPGHFEARQMMVDRVLNLRRERAPPGP